MRLSRIFTAAAVLGIAVAFVSCGSKPEEPFFEPCKKPNTLTRKMAKDGWKLLFDGETSQGWKSARGESFPEQGWLIEDGTLQVCANGGAESVAGGDIVTGAATVILAMGAGKSAAEAIMKDIEGK